MFSILGNTFKNSSRIRQFNFTPRYYNQEKEELKERYARIEAELNKESSLHHRASLSGLKDRWKRNKRTSNFEKKSNVRLVFIATLLFALCYWILYL